MLDLMLRPLTRPVTLRQGQTTGFDFEALEADHLTLQLTVVDDDDGPVDVSAWTTRTFTAFDAEGAQAFTLTPAFTTNGTNGRIDVALTNTQLDGLSGRYRYELQVIGTGIKLTAMKGIISVRATAL